MGPLNTVYKLFFFLVQSYQPNCDASLWGGMETAAHKEKLSWWPPCGFRVSLKRRKKKKHVSPNQWRQWFGPESAIKNVKKRSKMEGNHFADGGLHFIFTHRPWWEPAACWKPMEDDLLTFFQPQHNSVAQTTTELYSMEFALSNANVNFDTFYNEYQAWKNDSHCHGEWAITKYLQCLFCIH